MSHVKRVPTTYSPPVRAPNSKLIWMEPGGQSLQAWYDPDDDDSPVAIMNDKGEETWLMGEEVFALRDALTDVLIDTGREGGKWLLEREARDEVKKARKEGYDRGAEVVQSWMQRDLDKARAELLRAQTQETAAVNLNVQVEFVTATDEQVA
jgi:hypothetical protein